MTLNEKAALILCCEVWWWFYAGRFIRSPICVVAIIGTIEDKTDFIALWNWRRCEQQIHYLSPASTIQYNSDHQQRLHEWQWNSLFRSWKASICTPRASKYSMLLISPTSTIKQICTFATDYENCWTAFTPSPQHQSCRSVLMYSIYLNIYFLWFQSHSARGLCFKCPRHLITVTVVNLWFIPVTSIVISPNFHSLTRHYDQHDRPRLISGPRISVSPGGDIKL